MNISGKQKATYKRVGQILAFSAAIFCTTALALRSGAISSVSTVAFLFLIIVVLSAFFGNIVVAIFTSVVATLCFDFFFLPPFGTLNISAFPDWISLIAFLLTSVIISRLTASAAENKAQSTLLDASMIQLKEFGMWLISIPGNQLTLSSIAREALRIFSLEYCSIHVYGEGKWRHFTGAASSDVSRKIETIVDLYRDHKADLMEIVDENLLGVQYMKIMEGSELLGLFVVKTSTLSTNSIGAIAYMTGIRIMEIIKSNSYKNSRT